MWCCFMLLRNFCFSLSKTGGPHACHSQLECNTSNTTAFPFCSDLLAPEHSGDLAVLPHGRVTPELFCVLRALGAPAAEFASWHGLADVLRRWVLAHMQCVVPRLCVVIPAFKTHYNACARLRLFKCFEHLRLKKLQ